MTGFCQGSAIAGDKRLKLKVIACEVLRDEIGLVAKDSPHDLDLDFLPQGYHQTPQKGRAELQSRIDALPCGSYDAVLIGYGLCGCVLDGLVASHLPLVIPRAHDCLTLFLGSLKRYMRFFEENPGTYYFTTGWLRAIEKDTTGRSAPSESCCDFPVQTAVHGLGFDPKNLEKFDDDQRSYLAEVFNQWRQVYSRGVLIEFEQLTTEEIRERVARLCEDRGWEFKRVEGDLGLIKKWLFGEWSEEEFLIVPEGYKVVADYTDGIVKAVKE